MAKGLTRKISRKQALSYRRSRPNGIGVTAIAAVNGRGARRKKRKGPPAGVKRAMKECGALVKKAWKTAKKTKGRAKKNGRASSLSDRGMPAGDLRHAAEHGTKSVRAAARAELRRRGLKAKNSKRWVVKDLRSAARYADTLRERKAAKAELKRRGLKLRPNQAAAASAPPPAATPNRAYRRRYAETKRVLRNLAKPNEESEMKANKRGRKRSKKRLKGAAFKRSAQYKKMQAGLKRFRAKKGRKSSGKRRASGAKRKRTTGRKTARKSSRRKSARSKAGGLRPISVKLGGKTVKTYLYRTKSGTVRHLPKHAILGFKSQGAMNRAARKSPKVLGRVVAREQAIRRARERASERLLKHGDIFTPNTTVVPYSEWSANMKANRRKKKSKGRRRQSAKQRAASLRNLRKARAARRSKKSSGRKRRKSRKGTRKAARRRTKKTAATRRRRRKGGKRAAARRRKGSARKRTRRSSKRRAAPKGRRRSAKRRGTSRKAARRALRTLSAYRFNGRRRRHRRGYRRNSAWMEQLKQGLKLGAIVVGGFIAHKALSKLLNDQVLSKVSALQTGAAAPYSSLIAGAIVAAAGIPLAAKFLSREKALNVGAGIAASFLHAAVVTLLGKANQPAVAAYFSGYPDRSGPAYHGYGEYFIPPGMGEYFLPPGMSGFGDAAIMQAAAGYGDAAIMQAAAGYGDAAIMQAAAGYGAGPVLSQAAAGTGEYMLTGGSAYGDYEMVQAGPMHGMGYTDEGIMGGDLNAAEYALNQAEAAAGIGDIPLESTIDPTMVAQPVEDVPGGMRSGILQGSDGIFG